MADLRDVFADNLRKFRKIKGFTQDELAERSRLSVGTVKSYEAKRRWPEKPYIEALAKALNVDETELFAQDVQDKEATQVKSATPDFESLDLCGRVLCALASRAPEEREILIALIFDDEEYFLGHPEARDSIETLKKARSL